MSEKKNYRNFVYQFVGGVYGGKTFNYHEVEVRGLIKKFSENWSSERANGRCVPREELDNQPVIDGYLGPMYDGVRYIVDGQMKRERDCTEEEKSKNRCVCVIRYESPDVYERLSR